MKVKVKAKISFAGIVTMGVGDVREVDSVIADDLLRAGYVEMVEKPAKATKKGAKNED
jgi:hypothetical protein